MLVLCSRHTQVDGVVPLACRRHDEAECEPEMAFSWKCLVRYLNNAKTIKCMADGMHMHHIYHAACAVLKKLWETDLPREALRLVEPVVSSFPFARHLRRFTCKPKHTTTVHASARVQCTEQKQLRLQGGSEARRKWGRSARNFRAKACKHCMRDGMCPTCAQHERGPALCVRS